MKKGGRRKTPAARPESVSPQAPRSHRAALIAAAICFCVSLAVYILTAARTVTFVDSGELIVACSTLGIAHPPGFPLYTVLGFLCTLFPLGSVAFRVTLLSSVSMAVASAVVALVVNELSSCALAAAKSEKGGRTRNASSPAPIERRAPWVADAAVSTAAGLSFAFSKTAWAYAVVAEVYALNILLLSFVILLVLLWERYATGTDQDLGLRSGGRLLAAAALVYGLALGVHHVTVFLALPGLVFWVWRAMGKRFLKSSYVLISAAALVGGTALVYLYLPIAAFRQPVFNWGDPQTLERFVRHVTGWQYQAYFSDITLAVVAKEVKYFLLLAYWQFTPLGLIAALAGFWALRRSNRRSLHALLLIALFDIGYSVLYEIAEDKDAYYLPTWLVLSLGIGAGLHEMMRVVRWRGAAMRAAAFTLAAALPSVNFAAHLHESNKRGFLLARDFVENTFKSVGSGGLLLTIDWQLYSPYLYLRHVEGFRKDATVVDVNLMRRSWYVEQYLNREYPALMRDCRDQAEAFLKCVRLFEAGAPYDPEEIQRTYIALFDAMIEHHLSEGKSVGMTLPPEPDVGTGYAWVPSGLVLCLYPQGQEPPFVAAPQLELRGLLDGSIAEDDVIRIKIKPSYAVMLTNGGKYLSLHGEYDEALRLLDIALQLSPDFDRAFEFRGDVFAAQARWDDATRAYQEALSLNPGNDSARGKLQELSPRGPTP